MKLILSILTLCIILQSQLQAQEVLPITLEKVLELGGANNLTIKEYIERQELATAKLSKAKEWWLPEIYGGARSHFLNGAVMNGNGNFFLDANRNNLWLGLGLNASWNFAEGIYNTKSAEFRSKASAYQSQAERNKVLLQSVNAYYNLMEAQLNLVAFQNLVAQSDTIIDQIQIQVDAGILYQSEVLLAKSNKNHLKVAMLNAQKEYNTTSATLLKLLNLGQQVKLVITDNHLLPLNYTESLVAQEDPKQWNRPEMKAIELEIQALKYNKKSYTSGMLFPRINIGTNGSYFGRFSGNVSPMDPIAFPVTNQLYPTGTLNASLIWSIPIGALTYNGENKQYSSMIRIKEIQTEQLKAKINEEVASAKIQIEIGKEQIEITKEALELTSEALSQSIERQKLGTARSFEVFQAQQFYLQAQVDYLKSISEYNKAQFALKVAKGETL